MEEGTEATPVSTTWTGRNGVVRSPTNQETLFHPPEMGRKKGGPTYYATVRVHDIKSAFGLFFTPVIIDLVVENTNLYGHRNLKEWKELDATEFQAFLGLLILSGLFRSKGESTASLWGPKNGRAIFGATMTRNRFHQIMNAVRFDDKEQRRARFRDDRLAPIRSLWDMWRVRLSLLYNTGSDVTIDEQLVPFKGRCKFRQYMPKKPAKYGLKIWMATDACTSYVWRCSIYTGRSGDAREVGQGRRVVLELLEDVKGITVTCDNFFTSFQLGQELLKKKIALVGTIRKNKPELPPKLLDTKGRDVLSSVFAFTRTTMAVSYVPKRGRNVVLISTKHRQPVIAEGPKRKPEVITDYNRCKGGVDNLDKL
ncbi:LOW QUALITY PROTEIN: piggyBac transposable element-derived protein 3-like [Xyrichtys novacula]|uniref:LOW QUALITY PROTEIN: piggyBac transposable element-derived protein 3-like n=1 Tax=Xyrichtys novacula TaxID=13765 RepID=A0AAV1H5A8_XYRNO|nr:LOW QUALITY PROTEIN: piggyBac transposable element-derived protein 3-like [Xyrichtys novacula]